MTRPTIYQKFLSFAAICSLFGALTTALLLFLPNPPADDFGSRVQLHGNWLYLSKLWILFFHPQFNIIASLGLAVVLWRKYPLLVIVGSLFLLVWAYTEMSQQAFLIDALNQYWRPAYLNAENEETRNVYFALITGAGGISDSKYFLVIYGFGLGSLLFGLALIHEEPLGRMLGLALVFIGILSLSSFLRYYLGLHFLSAPVDWSYTYIYPLLQPAVRIGIAYWIWRQVKQIRIENTNQA